MLLFGIAYIHICSVVVVTLVLILALEAGAIRLGGGGGLVRWGCARIVTFVCLLVNIWFHLVLSYTIDL
jgi:hypothetical protein